MTFLQPRLLTGQDGRCFSLDTLRVVVFLEVDEACGFSSYVCSYCDFWCCLDDLDLLRSHVINRHCNHKEIAIVAGGTISNSNDIYPSPLFLGTDLKKQSLNPLFLLAESWTKKSYFRVYLPYFKIFHAPENVVLYMCPFCDKVRLSAKDLVDHMSLHLELEIRKR
jgi:hypothetical protein